MTVLCDPVNMFLLFSSLVMVDIVQAADTLKGLVSCMNNEDCLGTNRICSHDDRTLTGKCVCREGYVQEEDGFACSRKVSKTRSIHATCETDEDCKRNEV